MPLGFGASWLCLLAADSAPRPFVWNATGHRDEVVRQPAGHEIDVAVMGRSPPELRTVASAFAQHPIARDWYVMHLASRQVPRVAAAFDQFLREQAPAQVQRQLGHVCMPARKKPTARVAASSLAKR